MSLIDLRMNTALTRAISQFEKINRSERLTEADKQQLKNAYLQNCFEPETRELLKAKLARRLKNPRRATP